MKLYVDMIYRLIKTVWIKWIIKELQTILLSETIRYMLKPIFYHLVNSIIFASLTVYDPKLFIFKTPVRIRPQYSRQLTFRVGDYTSKHGYLPAAGLFSRGKIGNKFAKNGNFIILKIFPLKSTIFVFYIMICVARRCKIQDKRNIS